MTIVRAPDDLHHSAVMNFLCFPLKVHLYCSVKAG
jgi:hypothetical protein